MKANDNAEAEFAEERREEKEITAELAEGPQR
jgi:hypothetical protein